MDLKERLLQNEIQHLGQIIQTLSYELIVLQDFLKEEYGSKFEAYRSKYSGNEPTCSSYEPRPGKSKKTPNRHEKDDPLDPTSDCETSNVPQKNELVNDPSDEGNLTSVTDNDISGLHSDSDGNACDEIEMECGESDEDFKPGDFETNSCGPHLKPCWSEFHLKRNSSGKKISATCKQCGSKHINPRAYRLENHLRVCRGGDQSLQDTRKRNPGATKAKSRLQLENSRFNRQAHPDMLKEGPGPRGRFLKQAWLYFDVVKNEEGKRISACCKWCGHRYSHPRVEKLIRHLEKCQDRNGGKDNPNTSTENT